MVSPGAQTIGKIKDTLMEVNERYNRRPSQIIRQLSGHGGREARNQQDGDFFIGLGIGITMGLGSELPFARRGRKMAWSSPSKRHRGVEGSAGMAVKSSGWTTVVGQDPAPPRGLDPMVLELDIYRLIESPHHSVFDVARYCDSLFLINGAATNMRSERSRRMWAESRRWSQLDLL